MSDLGLEGGVSLACLGALTLALATATRGAAARESRRGLVVVLGITLLGLAHHLAFVAPAFVHAELYGPELISDILDYPQATPRHAYGATSYLVLGGLSHLFGRSAEGVLTANVFVYALAAIPLAALAARLSGRPRAALYAAALFGSSPLVARLARSEDAHGVALLFGLVAAVAVDYAARERSRLALFAAAPALALMLSARQTFHGWVPLLLLLALGRPAPKAGAIPPRWRAVPLVVAATVLLSFVIARAGRRGDEGFGILLLAYQRLAAAPGNFLPCLSAHPLFDLPGIAFVWLPLALLGAFALAREGGAPRAAMATGLAVTFATTLPATWPAHGSIWAFRLPFYVLYLLLVAVGLTRIEAFVTARARRVGSRLGERSTALLLCSAVAAAALLSRAAGENRRPNAELADYVWLRDTLAIEQARGPVGLVGLAMHYPAPRYSATREIARRLDIPFTTPDRLGAARADTQRRWLFHEGLGCSAYTVTELLLPEAGTEELVGARLLKDPALLDLLLFDRARRFGAAQVEVPASLRAACRGLVVQAGAGLVVGPSIAAADDPPAVLYLPTQRFVPRLIPIVP